MSGLCPRGLKSKISRAWRQIEISPGRLCLKFGKSAALKKKVLALKTCKTIGGILPPPGSWLKRKPQDNGQG